VDERTGLKPEELCAIIGGTTAIVRSSTTVTPQVVDAATRLRHRPCRYRGRQHRRRSGTRRGAVMNTPGGNNVTTRRARDHMLLALASIPKRPRDALRQGRSRS
jgi:hypothetical protein